MKTLLLNLAWFVVQCVLAFGAGYALAWVLCMFVKAGASLVLQ